MTVLTGLNQEVMLRLHPEGSVFTTNALINKLYLPHQIVACKYGMLAILDAVTMDRLYKLLPVVVTKARKTVSKMETDSIVRHRIIALPAEQQTVKFYNTISRTASVVKSN